MVIALLGNTGFSQVSPPMSSEASPSFLTFTSPSPLSFCISFVFPGSPNPNLQSYSGPLHGRPALSSLAYPCPFHPPGPSACLPSHSLWAPHREFLLCHLTFCINYKSNFPTATLLSPPEHLPLCLCIPSGTPGIPGT